MPRPGIRSRGGLPHRVGDHLCSGRRAAVLDGRWGFWKAAASASCHITSSSTEVRTQWEGTPDGCKPSSSTHGGPTPSTVHQPAAAAVSRAASFLLLESPTIYCVPRIRGLSGNDCGRYMRLSAFPIDAEPHVDASEAPPRSAHTQPSRGARIEDRICPAGSGSRARQV